MPDTITPKHFAIIRVAKEQVGMSEDDYRALLSRLTGQETAKALTPQTFKKLMAHFEALGFISTEAKKNASRHPLKATEAQMRKISELWAIFTDGTGTETSLRHWMEKRGYGCSVGWLDGGTARRVIGALTKMVARGR
ncbi:uncharacterized protein DUF1018 [Rhodobacter viridis]|uniref:Uncharacterized protein DUF1018 n=1 Tax=Rhodobacter viridis TaxID=1054202 RepID=A0A318TWE7_9RHOB|nr:regulatory protein GemA [Rhodobacter viridis]PYF08230.1 uncharacterized protein DUF1018 [Rhodobacter viridis]